MESCFAIRGDICYSAGPRELHTMEGGYLVSEGGLSAGVYAALPERYAGCPVEDYGHALVLPGLCDLHIHAPQFAFRALGMDLELLDWLNTRTFPEEAKYSDLDYAGAVYRAFVGALLRGPNTRAVIFATPHIPATVLLMELLEASGLCTLVGKVNMDRNSPDDLREADAEASLANTRAWLAQVQGRFRHTGPILTPRFLPACSDALLRGLGELRQETGLSLQSHLSENPGECRWVRELVPEAEGYGDAYRRFGLLDGPGNTVMAHCVWSDDDEIAMMAGRGIYMAHCPQSNANLASGIAPVRRFLERGVPAGLGSDMAGGCHASIFRAMSDAIQASKLHWRLQCDAEPALSLEEAFYLATVGGGSFFGQVGSFDAGYELDAIVVDDALLAAPYPLDIAERLARVTYLSDDRHIRGKYVQGRRIYENNPGA